MRVPALLACVGLAGALAGVGATVARAAPALQDESDPYPGVHRETWVDAAIPARLHVARIDLSSQELTLFATAEADRGQRTSQWAAGAGVQVAINGDAFAIAGFVPAGLAMGGSAAWSTTADDAASGFLRFARVGERTQAAIAPPEQVVAAADLPAGTQGVVSGRPLLVRAGQPVASFDCDDELALPCARAPRAAVAVSGDGNTLWLVVVDGWQAGSLGMTCAELAAFLDARGIDRAIIAGNSMGGGIALRFAHDFPERVRALVLVASVGPVHVANELTEALARGENLLTPGSREQTEAFLRTVTARPPRVPRAVQRYVTSQRIASKQRLDAIFSGWAEAPDDERIPHDLAGITAPALIIHGAQDRIIHPATADILASRLPRARRVILDGIGHVPQLEAPARVAQLIARFVATV